MKNYDKIMEEMTPEIMANQRVKMVIVNQSEPFYMTSRGQLYSINNLHSAVVDEFNYLITDIPGTEPELTRTTDVDDVSEDKSQPDRNEKPEK